MTDEPVPTYLNYRPPEQRYTLQELNIAHGQAVSDYAISSPFQLLSSTGIEALKSEILTEEVQSQCKFSCERTACCLRGVSRYCPLLKRLWSSQEVTDIVSNIAGVKLKPVMEYELGVCNIQVPDARGDDAPVDDWHTDSYPFVAIVMLSDTAGLEGGETLVKRGNGTVLPFAFPCAGSCLVMQGQHVKHCARRVVSGPRERVTMVTSYVPADPCLPDRSIMKGTWRVSDRSQLYYGWAKYRFASLAAQANARLSVLENRPEAAVEEEDVQDIMAWLTHMEEFTRKTREEMLHCEAAYGQLKGAQAVAQQA